MDARLRLGGRAAVDGLADSVQHLEINREGRAFRQLQVKAALVRVGVGEEGGAHAACIGQVEDGVAGRGVAAASLRDDHRKIAMEEGVEHLSGFTRHGQAGTAIDPLIERTGGIGGEAGGGDVDHSGIHRADIDGGGDKAVATRDGEEHAGVLDLVEEVVHREAIGEGVAAALAGRVERDLEVVVGDVDGGDDDAIAADGIEQGAGLDDLHGDVGVDAAIRELVAVAHTHEGGDRVTGAGQYLYQRGNQAVTTGAGLQGAVLDDAAGDVVQRAAVGEGVAAAAADAHGVGEAVVGIDVDGGGDDAVAPVAGRQGADLHHLGGDIGLGRAIGEGVAATVAHTGRCGDLHATDRVAAAGDVGGGGDPVGGRARECKAVERAVEAVAGAVGQAGDAGIGAATDALVEVIIDDEAGLRAGEVAVHVGLDGALCAGAGPDAHFVDRAGEILGAAGARADAEDVRGAGRGGAAASAGLLHTVEEDDRGQRRGRPACGDVGPGIARQCGRGRHTVIGPIGDDVEVDVVRTACAHRGKIRRAALGIDDAAEDGTGRIDPGLHREVIRSEVVKQAGQGCTDIVIAAVEVEGIAGLGVKESKASKKGKESRK